MAGAWEGPQMVSLKYQVILKLLIFCIQIYYGTEMTEHTLNVISVMIYILCSSVCLHYLP